LQHLDGISFQGIDPLLIILDFLLVLRGMAYLVSVGLTGIAAWFSINGMVVLFPPGAPTEIMVMGAMMEVAKLVGVAFVSYLGVS